MVSAEGSSTVDEETEVPQTIERPFQRMVREMKSRAELDGATRNVSDIVTQVMDAILSVDSPDGIFAAGNAGPAHLEEFVGKPLSVYEVEWALGDPKYQTITGCYAILHAFDDMGKEHVISTGANNVITQLWNAERSGFLSVDGPWRVAIKAKDTPNGTLYTLDKP